MLYIIDSNVIDIHDIVSYTVIEISKTSITLLYILIAEFKLNTVVIKATLCVRPEPRFFSAFRHPGHVIL